jgi:ADP-ribose pyrophosphatase YjhB (NUDIX family)
MYKVFINQKVLIFASEDQFDTQLINKKGVLLVANNIVSKKTFAILTADNKQNMFVLGSNVKKLWMNFVIKMKVIHAGGGLVLNNDEELLFIFRKGKWDLPKGKLDKGETIAACAVREVKEECGIKNLKLNKKLGNTYHVYSMKGKLVIKITTWYFMHLKKTQKLVPQAEEGIVKLKFFSKTNYRRTVKKNTYPLIADLADSIPNSIY